MKTLKTLILSAALFAASLNATTQSDPVFASGERPDYPEIARIANVEGTVVVEALVDEKGRVFAVDVVDSVHPALDAATVEAVSKWTFKPALKDGTPVMRVVRIPVDFKLVDPKAPTPPKPTVAKG